MNPGFADQPPLTAAQRDRLLELVDQRFGIRGSEYGASRIDSAVQRVLPQTGLVEGPTVHLRTGARDTPGA